MPGPIIADPTPDWLKPENASVFDSPLVKAIRALVNAAPAVNPLHTLVDPQAQALAVAAPLVPKGQETAGVLQAVMQKLRGRALGSLGATIKPGEIPGEYLLRDPTIDRVADLYRIGYNLPSTANWSGAPSAELIQAFGGDKDKALQWARLWGATSPNTSVPVNTRESISALAHSLERPGQALTVPQAQTLPDAKITMAPSKVPNINRALAGQPLSGDKVEAMAGFMTGEPRVPLDVHAIYGLGGGTDKLDTELPGLRAAMAKAEDLPTRGAGGLSNTEIYLRYEDAVSRALEQVEPDRSVNDVFATFWEGVRAHKGLKPQGGPIDILRKKGLLEAGAMLDPDRLRAALRTQGWTAGAIAGLMAALGSGGAGDAGASSAEESKP